MGFYNSVNEFKDMSERQTEDIHSEVSLCSRELQAIFVPFSL